MPGKKVGRKGKLDQDLPFRDRKTFAIFPKRFGGWEMYARRRDSGAFKNRRPTAVLPLVHSSLCPCFGDSPIKSAFNRFCSFELFDRRCVSEHAGYIGWKNDTWRRSHTSVTGSLHQVRTEDCAG